MQLTWSAFKSALLIMFSTAVAIQLVFFCIQLGVFWQLSARTPPFAANQHARELSLRSFPNTVDTATSTSSLSSCAWLSWQQKQTPNASGAVLCNLILTDLFQNSMLNTSLTVVTTKLQYLDQFPWHRCVVFGRFATVTTVDIAQFATNSIRHSPSSSSGGRGEGSHADSYLVLMERAGKMPQMQWLIRSAGLRRAPSIMLMADEQCNQDYTYWSSARTVLRHYHCDKDTLSNYVPNGFRELIYGKLPTFRANIPPNATCAGNVSIITASRRTHFFNYQGTVRRSRAKMATSVKSQYAVSTLSNARYYFSSDSIPGPSFQTAIFNSVFTLCPCGNNIETHRLWEALLAGSIPVQEDCSIDPHHRSNLSERQFILYLKQHLPHVIVIKDWDSLSSILQAYSNDSMAMDVKQKSLYISYMKLLMQIGTQSADLVLGVHANPPTHAK